jgi:hypothetical protein
MDRTAAIILTIVTLLWSARVGLMCFARSAV